MEQTNDCVMLSTTISNDDISKIEVATLGKRFIAKIATYRAAPEWTYEDDLVVDLIMRDCNMSDEILDRMAEGYGYGEYPNTEVIFSRKSLPRFPAILKHGTFTNIDRQFVTIIGRIEASNFQDMISNEILPPQDFLNLMNGTRFSRRLEKILKEG